MAHAAIGIGRIDQSRVGVHGEPTRFSDRDGASAAVPLQSSPVPVVLPSAMIAPLDVLSAAPPVGGFGRAAATVGLVLAVAIVLYVGYGALTRVASPVARELLEGD